MTLRELIETLTEMVENDGVDPDTEIRLAIQPRWAFEHSISNVVAVDLNESTNDFCEDHGCSSSDCGCEVEQEGDEQLVVYIGEGSQLGYLPGAASRRLGWR